MHTPATQQRVPGEGLPCASAQPATADIQPDAQEPGAKLLGVPQTAESEQSLEHRLLGRVLGQPGMSEGALAQTA